MRQSSIITTSRLYLPPALALMLFMSFSSFEWRLPRNALAWALTHCLRSVFGHEVSGLGVTILIDREIVSVAPECTYIDLILVCSPFVVRVERSFRHNMTRLAVFGVAVLVLNFARVVLAVHWRTRGVSWATGHDLLDYIIYYPLLLSIICFWLKSVLFSCRADNDDVTM